MHLSRVQEWPPSGLPIYCFFYAYWQTTGSYDWSMFHRCYLLSAFAVTSAMFILAPHIINVFYRVYTVAFSQSFLLFNVLYEQLNDDDDNDNDDGLINDVPHKMRLRLIHAHLWRQELQQTVSQWRPSTPTMMTSARFPLVTSQITWSLQCVVKIPKCRSVRLVTSTRLGHCWPPTGRHL